MHTAKRVLVIDDEPLYGTLVEKALQRGGNDAEVRLAGTGEEGLHLAATFQPDVIVLDYQLPDMDGLAVLDALHTRGIEAPVVLFTAHGDEGLAVQAMRHGASDYLSKVDVTDLRLGQTVRNVLWTWRIERSLAQQESLALIGALATTVLEGVEHGVGAIEQTAQPRPGAEVAFEVSVRGLQDIARTMGMLQRLIRGAAERRPTDVNAIVEDALRSGRSRRARLETRLGKLPVVDLDPDALRQCVLHLVHNAVEASPANGLVLVTTRQTDQSVEVIVEDEGPGVPEGIRLRAFDLFATTKEGHEGIGLTLVKHLSATLGGRVDFENRPRGGAVFRLVFPVAAASATVRPVATALPTETT